MNPVLAQFIRNIELAVGLSLQEIRDTPLADLRVHAERRMGRSLKVRGLRTSEEINAKVDKILGLGGVAQLEKSHRLRVRSTRTPTIGVEWSFMLLAQMDRAIDFNPRTSNKPRLAGSVRGRSLHVGNQEDCQ
jgi:hypothetical protein